MPLRFRGYLLHTTIVIANSEKAMAHHSSTFAWKIPWTEEPGGLQSMRSLRVGHDWATSFSLFTFTHWRRKWQPTPVFLPGESQGRGAWWAAVYGVAQSRRRLKWLSSRGSKFHPLPTVEQNNLMPSGLSGRGDMKPSTAQHSSPHSTAQLTPTKLLSLNPFPIPWF